MEKKEVTAENQVYKVLRGKNQIGGSVVEIITEKNKRIWVDFGSELSVDEKESTDKELIALMEDEKTRPDAIFFTHIHGDHVGLLGHITGDVKVYMGPLSRQLLINIRKTLLKVEKDKKKLKKLQAEYDILTSDMMRTYQTVDGKPLKICEDDLGVEYTALKVDHSVVDSYMLKFKIGDTVLVHTGDFRAHGRMGESLFQDVQDYFVSPKEPVNILVTEGTMMTRLDEAVLTEPQMQEKAAEYLKEHKYVFLICSSTNIDSLASFHNAMAEVDPKRKFYCNYYVKEQLDLCAAELGKKEGRSQYLFENTEVILPGLKGQIESMLETGFVMMVGQRENYRKMMEQFREYNPSMIYSMWGGYLEEGQKYTNQELCKTVKAWEPNVYRLHTSGHATADTIVEVIRLLHPTDRIQPIHTENPYGFYMLNIGNDTNQQDDLRRKIIVDSPGEYWKLPEDFDFSTKEKDNRAIRDKYPDLWSALSVEEKDGKVMRGSLRAFVDMVNDKQDLELCFRGNTGKQCVIYYHNNEFFKIGIVDQKPRLSFNMNHARYWSYFKNNSMEQLETKLQETYGLRYHVSSDKKVREFVGEREYTLEELRELYELRKKMMDSYFSLEDQLDFYQNKPVENLLAKPKWEKQEQQKLMTANCFFKDGYYIYDMEYAQPYADKDYKQTYKVITGKSGQNKPDSMAIRFDSDGNPKALVLVELKTTSSAMENKSGAVQHIRGMKNYVLNPLNKPFLEHRKKEAYDIITEYQKLGIHSGDVEVYEKANISLDAFMALDIELLLVITDNNLGETPTAKTYFDTDNNREELLKEANAGRKKCGILLLEPNQFRLNYHDIINL